MSNTASEIYDKWYANAGHALIPPAQKDGSTIRQLLTAMQAEIDKWQTIATFHEDRAAGLDAALSSVVSETGVAVPGTDEEN